jgi:hypothetical protein
MSSVVMYELGKNTGKCSMEKMAENEEQDMSLVTSVVMV